MDAIILTGNDDSDIEDLKAHLHKVFRIKDLEITLFPRDGSKSCSARDHHDPKRNSQRNSC